MKRATHRISACLSAFGSVLVLDPPPAEARTTEFVGKILRDIEDGVRGDQLDRAALKRDFENIGGDLYAAYRKFEAHDKEEATAR